MSRWFRNNSKPDGSQATAPFQSALTAGDSTKIALKKNFPAHSVNPAPLHVIYRADKIVKVESEGTDQIDQQTNSPFILIVDNQLDNLDALEAILEAPCRTILRASSGSEALRRLLHQDVALILLAVHMPVMTGFETARLIRTRERSRTTPIIFTTAKSDREMELEGYSAGGVDFLEKPFEPDILRAKVNAFLKLAKTRQQLEEEIQLRRLAERKLARVARRLRTRAKELEIANQELEAFAYSASHDLRAPLRHIAGFVNVLQEEPETDLEFFLDRIAGSADKMNQLLDDLLAFSKVGRMEMTMAPVNLEALLDEVINDLEPEWRDRTVLWKRTPLPSVNGDSAMLRQVLVNLLSNALKYSVHADPTKIEIGSQLAGDEATIFIRDNGAGFKMEFADKLFKAFHRLHLGNEFHGSGIGLANVQRIIHRHGGRVWGEGKVGIGATFYFALPLASDHAGLGR